MPIGTPASDQELIDLIDGADRDVHVVGLERRPYIYATSAPLERLAVRMSDGSEQTLIFKDISRARLLPGARAAKPDFAYEPLRELETYRRILARHRIGPRLVAVSVDAAAAGGWLVIDKIDGVELWQIGELEAWEEVARWLAGLHAAFADRAAVLKASNPYLIEHSKQWLDAWADRARLALAESDDPRATAVRKGLGRYEQVSARIAQLPRTLVHGELYPSNVLVARDGRSVQPYLIDWEMAAIGSGLIDVAALTAGWDEPDGRRLERAYLAAVPQPRSAAEVFEEDLTRCRLQLALQWLGWSPTWRPPQEHRHDWLGEALRLMQQLGLA